MDNRPCAELTMEWLRPESMLPPWLGGISESNPDDQFKYEEPPPVLNTKSIYFFLAHYNKKSV